MKSTKETLFFLHIPAMCKLSMLFLLCVSCSRRTLSVRSDRTDSVRVERVTEYRERLRIDTVYVPVPAQTSQQETRDSTSHLETDFAASDARINPDGTLYHDLRNKVREWPVSVPVTDRETVSRRDSIAFRDVSVEVPVKMPLSWWEKFWIRVGQVALGGVLLLVLVRVGKGRWI